MKSDRLKGNLDMLLLAALKKGPSHGYAIIESLRAHSGGNVDLAAGTVYPALHHLEEIGLIKSGWSSAAEGARRRRVYQLTARGRTTLATEVQGWRVFCASINGVLGGCNA